MIDLWLKYYKYILSKNSSFSNKARLLLSSLTHADWDGEQSYLLGNQDM